MIFLPLFIGQALVQHTSGAFSGTAFLYALLFGLLYQVYLLYTNDHADEVVDRSNEQYWLSGGSRVLPEGKLGAGELLMGARVALVLLGALTLTVAVFGDRPWLVAGTVLAVVLSWAYNRKPLQLSYRGQGEVLQGLGCGVVLPLIGFYLQQGSLQHFPWGTLIPLYTVFHAGNLVTALPDYGSDKAGGKNTFPVRHGELAARATALLLLAFAYLSLLVVHPALSTPALAIIVAPAGLVLAGVSVSGLLGSANVADFPRCKAFVAWVSASQAWFLVALAIALLLERAA